MTGLQKGQQPLKKILFALSPPYGGEPLGMVPAEQAAGSVIYGSKKRRATISPSVLLKYLDSELTHLKDMRVSS